MRLFFLPVLLILIFLVTEPAAAAPIPMSQNVVFTGSYIGSWNGTLPIPQVGSVGVEIGVSVRTSNTGIFTSTPSAASAQQGSSATVSLDLKPAQSQGEVRIFGEFVAGPYTYPFSNAIPTPDLNLTQNVNVPLSPFSVNIPVFEIDITLSPSLGVQNSVSASLVSNDSSTVNPSVVNWTGQLKQSSQVTFKSNNATTLSISDLTSHTKLNLQVGVGVYGLPLMTVPITTVAQGDSGGVPVGFCRRSIRQDDAFATEPSLAVALGCSFCRLLSVSKAGGDLKSLGG